MIREVVVDGVMSFLFVGEGGSGAGCGGGAEAVEAGYVRCRSLRTLVGFGPLGSLKLEWLRALTCF